MHTWGLEVAQRDASLKSKAIAQPVCGDLNHEAFRGDASAEVSLHPSEGIADSASAKSEPPHEDVTAETKLLGYIATKVAYYDLLIVQIDTAPETDTLCKHLMSFVMEASPDKILEFGENQLDQHGGSVAEVVHELVNGLLTAPTRSFTKNSELRV